MLFPCGRPWLREGSPASGAEGAGWPLDRRSRERERGCSLCTRLPQSFLPGLRGPIPHPHSMPHALSSSRRRAHLPDTHTCIHCLLITMSVSGHGGAVGSHPDRQVSAFPGEWEGGMGEQGIGAHISAPPHHLLGPAHPHPCPPPQCQLPGLTERLGPAKDRTRGCILGLDSATPTHSRPDLAPTQRQSPALGQSSGVQPASLPHKPRPLRGQQCGDSAATAASRRGAGRVGSAVFGFGGPCLWLLSPLRGPGSWHCPCPWSACRAGCCGRRCCPVFNHLSFQTSATAGPSR